MDTYHHLSKVVVPMHKNSCHIAFSTALGIVNLLSFNYSDVCLYPAIGSTEIQQFFRFVILYKLLIACRFGVTEV